MAGPVAARARRDSGTHAGLFIDLDGFKPINDRLGHDGGDNMLRLIARRLQSAVRQTDFPRLGGDEFFVLAYVTWIHRRAPASSRRSCCMHCRTELATRPETGGLGASIGICVLSGAQFAGKSEQIICAADRAMYEAKSGGKHRHALPRLTGGGSPWRTRTAGAARVCRRRGESDGTNVDGAATWNSALPRRGPGRGNAPGKAGVQRLRRRRRASTRSACAGWRQKADLASASAAAGRPPSPLPATRVRSRQAFLTLVATPNSRWQPAPG